MVSSIARAMAALVSVTQIMFSRASIRYSQMS